MIYDRSKICLQTQILEIIFRSDFLQPKSLDIQIWFWTILDVYLFLFRAHLSLSTTEWRWDTFDCNFWARWAQWPYIPYTHCDMKKIGSTKPQPRMERLQSESEWRLWHRHSWGEIIVTHNPNWIITWQPLYIYGAMIWKSDTEFQSGNQLSKTS